MPDCLFCTIAAGTEGVTFHYEDDAIVAFDDISPKAPTHILIVPKQHLESVAALESPDESLIGHLVYVARRLAADQNLEENGYRLVFNTRSHAGQTVDHLHLHLLGGRPLGSMVS